MQMVTYGTPRVFLRLVGQYHEPCARICGSPEEAEQWAARWNNNHHQNPED
jgi:hypothetical protein